MDRYPSRMQEGIECGTLSEEERSRELNMARADKASAAGERLVDAVVMSKVIMGGGKKDAPSTRSVARSAPSMGRPSGPGTRRSPSPAIGTSNLRAGDNAPRSTSATRSSKLLTSRSSSLTRAPNTVSENAFCRNLNSNPHCNLISKSKSDSQPKKHSKALPSLAATAEVNIRSPIRPARQLAKLSDGPTSPSPKDTHQKKPAFEGPMKTVNVHKDSGLRSSGGLEAISCVSASRRHSLSAPLAQRIPSTPRRRTSDPRSLQQVDSKAGEDVRLDLRGQNLWRLDQIAASLTSKLEFVYLRDNKLSSLDGFESLRRVKVLDLSFNEFRGSGFEAMANCKALQQLYLAGNQITTLSTLPQLPNLEFLSVAQNKLKSLIMSSQPKLQVLAASSNKIATFKGFPHLPVLEHLRLEENPILDIPHVEAASILVVGETLQRFNNQDLSVEELKLALAYPAHTALCLREGWDFCSVDEASESTLQFLVAQWRDRLPPGLRVKRAVIDSPSEEDCCSCCFILEKETGILEDFNVILTYQWFLGDKTATNFLPIEGAITKTYWPKRQDIGRCLKVECKPVIQGTEFPSIFAISGPVTAGTGCPKVLSLRVDGELIEGSSIRACAEVAWCGGTPGKAIVSWLRRHGGSSPVAIMGAEDHQYQLTVDDVGANLLLMYTPVTEEGVKGESQFATTALIQAAAPRVRDVHVIGPLVEGATIKAAGRYFGGREGKSVFEWLREDVQSGKFKLASRGTVEYCLSKDDVGLRLMFTYTPINIEGIQGDSVSAITSKVLVAPPKVTQLKILGDIREGNIVSINASIVGGTEDASRVQWFKTLSADSSLEDVSLEAISSSKIAKDFRIPVGAVGYHLAAKYIPGCQDGEYGEAVLVVSEHVVQMLPPSLTFLSVNGEAKEGETLTASYGYVGGHEGRSEYNWYLHEDESDPGISVTSACGLLQYKVTADAVDKLISFRCTPVREDGTAGESRSTMMQDYVQPGLPTLASLEITGDPIEGATLHVDKKYLGGSEGSSKIQWLLKMENGLNSKIPNAIFSSYNVRKDDINCSICVSYEPIRADGVKGAAVVSEAIGPVVPGPPTCESLKIIGQPIEGGCLGHDAVYIGGDMGVCRTEWYRRSSSGKDDWLSNSDTLDVTSKDVGCCILLSFTPVRKDGLIGAPLQILSDAVKNADPVGLSISISDCCEGVEIFPRKSYYGGTEGPSEIKWFRVQHSFSGSTLPDDAVLVANSLTYTPTPKDVGMHIALSWTPVRSDGKVGKPLITCSSGSVAPALPSVRNVTIKLIGTQKLLGQGDYLGGSEGNSKLSWFRDSEDGTLSLIEGAESETYIIAEEDYTQTLIFGYTPVREDGAVGERVLSERSPVILPDVPRPLKLLLSGKAIESELLSSTGVMFENEADEVTWNKYKKDVKYQWLRSISPAGSKSFEILPLQRTNSYKVRSEDVDYVLRCECIMTDVFGRNMEPVAAMTSPVLPGTPKMDKVEIEGRGYHTNLYAVRGIYSGGKEGKSMIQWFRAVAGRPDLIPIIGEIGRMYEANVDDIGCRLVAVYTPVREDGVGGVPVSASTEPIAVEPEVAREVKQKLELGAVKFEALRDRELPTMKGLGSLERRILDVNKKRFKVVKPGSKTSFPNTEIRGTYSPPFHVDIIQNDQHRLKIVVESENEVDLMVQTRHIRDVIVLVLRGFALRFNALSLPTLLKP
ncbi:hypothetical protein GOP47_0001929 [Adiantum capillus-veneris]|uniref:187-kDa microtubule-associated protein AIR9 n=1 Tax=Adiantum capillus-veneris TaxID=13818 RepID=A0A9D4V971_ADICA|nr:hypothetical protein GOP47_0001929 [Adiantum capillus-veneris]